MGLDNSLRRTSALPAEMGDILHFQLLFCVSRPLKKDTAKKIGCHAAIVEVVDEKSNKSIIVSGPFWGDICFRAAVLCVQ